MKSEQDIHELLSAANAIATVNLIREYPEGNTSWTLEIISGNMTTRYPEISLLEAATLLRGMLEGYSIAASFHSGKAVLD